MFTYIFSLGLVLVTTANAILLPNSTGPYRVGTTVLEIVDEHRIDQLAPSPQARDLVISLFYPTDTANCSFSPQFPPTTAVAVDSFVHVPNGTVGAFQAPTCLNAPLTKPDLPILLFSPGLGASRLLYSTSLANVASYGWNVVSVDHTYEASPVEYPDGRVAAANPIPTANDTEAEIIAWLLERLDVRVADMISVLDALSDPAVVCQIPGLGTQPPHLRTDKVGVYGHSFGGATSLLTVANNTRFQAGVNLDGQLFGPIIQSGVDSPFMFFGSRSHNTETDIDRSWADVWPNLRGFKRQYIVDGVEHNSYTDMPVFRDILGDLFPSKENTLGPINGSRILGIEAAYISAFFGRFLKGEDGALLNGQGADEWPEVEQI